MLIYDYDGVLMDSVREVAVTAHNMLTGEIITRLDQIPTNALALFLKNRFHVQPIGDAPVLMKWCLETAEAEPEKLLSDKAYEDIIGQAVEPLADRTTRFFDTRSRFKAKDFNAWIALNHPVQPIWRLLIEKQSRELVILTNKNREATITLNRHFGLDVCNSDIYSGDNGATKIANMKSIMQRFKDSSYAFIDDSVKNLCEIDAHFNIDKKLVSLILAEWGYTGPDDARLAESLGYQTVAIDEFMDQLKRSY